MNCRNSAYNVGEKTLFIDVLFWGVVSVFTTIDQ
jgi:hypothetical protein